MQVYLAEKAGFCFGVKRAIDLTQEIAKHKEGPVYTLGPIIHNPQVVERLKQQGVYEIKEIDEVPPGNLILRSHGVAPEIILAAERYGHHIIDATCPFVKRAQQLAADLAKKNDLVVVVGDREHPEVKGILGWAGAKGVAIENVAEIDKMLGYNQVGVIAQTTQPVAIFNKMVLALEQRGFDVKACNTICNATSERQEAALNLTKKVTLMIVVGGANSANTGKLAKLCRNTGVKTYQIETASELKAEWFAGVKRAGLTAGASTPSCVIEEVVTKMNELGENTENQEGAQMETMGENMDVRTPHAGELLRGVVVQVNNDEVLVDIHAKSEGVITLKELTSYNANPEEIVKVGDEIEVVVLKSENDDKIELSKVRADMEKNWDSLTEVMEQGTIIQGEVREVVKGGLLIDVGVRAFLPASLVEVGYVEDLSKYLNEKFDVRVIEMNKARRKVIVSRKIILEEKRLKDREELFANLAEGQKVKGIVRRLTDFGAFVDIGGADGLLHISEMAWYRVNHPSEVVAVNDEIEVMVLKVDTENEKISLGLKQVLPNPWDNVEEKYPVDSIVNAKVVRLAPFGAFVQLEPGVEGLVHISHLAEEHVEKPEDVVTAGQEINVKVLSVDPTEKRIRLSIREVNREHKPRQPKKNQVEVAAQEKVTTDEGESGGYTLAETNPELAEMLKANK